ncbi:MAG: hypothetical protein ABI771_11920 [Betaproteobacteria bacterium]
MVAGLAPVAFALDWLSLPAGDLPFPLWTIGCAGAAMLFAGGALLADSMPLPRDLLAVLSISTFASLFDWLAFHDWPQDWGLLLNSLLSPSALRQNALHDVIVLFAVLLTLLAVFAWVQWLRDLTHRDGTPLRATGRKGKARESAE